ncbi:MAG TPA: SET domain-containing protein-lysine N-methyltransferase [Candidatus Moranbacteria bacterium]|nr:SET domain-containing protein-lysine N-methyltransferase [Candidatus Moranbacteria bacterium]
MNKIEKREFSWMNPSLEIRDTNKYGKGVFAKEDIKKSEILTIFGGYVKTIIEEEKLDNAVSDEGIQISDKLCFGILQKEDLEGASFFNHNCNPNAGFKGQIFLVSMRKIKKDEEICFDYAMVLSKSKGAKFYKIKCGCGSTNCRKFVTDNDWKRKDLQDKYDGFFQWYLQEKIKNKK